MAKYFLLTFLLLLSFTKLPGQSDEREQEYELPRRVMPLEKALMKLTQAGATLSYRPDQLPPLAIKVPGGKRTLPAWLDFLLKDTDLTYEPGPAGIILFPDPDLFKRSFNVYGLITDGESGERLIGAALQSLGRPGGTLTNEYGFYSLSARGGRGKIRVSYVGYQPKELDFVLRSDTLIDLSLRPNRELPTIIVTPLPEKETDVFLMETRNSVTSDEASRLGGIGGEADPLHVARLLPGVETGADGLGGIFIRGSEAGHNLVLLDGVPVYNLSHASGLLSIFSNQAIRRVDIYKDGLPARFGGRIGGVIDVHTRDGNLYESKTTVGSSLLSAHFASEGPIESGRSSYLITGRYFWAGELLRRFSEREKERLGRTGQMNSQIYDVNFKINQHIGDRGRLYFSFYKGLDNYSNNSFASDTITVLNDAGAVFRYATPRSRQEEVSWGNTVAALRYNHIFNDRFFGNFRLSYSDLLLDASSERSDSLNRVFVDEKNGDIFSGRYASDIQQIGMAFDGQLSVGQQSSFRFGSEINFHRFLPQLRSGSIPLANHPKLSSLRENGYIRPLQISAYSSFQGRLSKGIYYRLGLRGQLWRNEVNFFDLAPRLLLAGKLGQRNSWRLSYDRTIQPVHLVSSTVIGLPSDLWVPSTPEIAPSSSSQIAAQVSRKMGEDWNIVAAAYYKDMKGLIAYSEGGLASQWIDSLSQGTGFSRGIELSLNRTRGRLKGWVNYTLAQSRRQFDQRINIGRPFNFRFGRQHALKTVLMWEAKPGLTLTANFRISSGAAYSLSSESLLLPDPAVFDDPTNIESIALVKDKNGITLPSNHRLDLNAHFVFNGKPGSSVTHELDVGVYNVYSRHNPIYYNIQTTYFGRESELISQGDFIQVYLSPVVPTLAYHLKFGGQKK